jgi:PAS domain S-box-containing protein
VRLSDADRLHRLGRYRAVFSVEDIVRRPLIRVWAAHLINLVRGRSARTLLETERRLQILSDAVQDFAIFRLGPGGEVVSWDAGAERLKGYTADEIIGQNYARFFVQEDIEEGAPQRHLQIAAATGRFEIEHWRVRKDGSRFWAAVIVTAVRNPSGDITGFYEISRRIGAREEAAAQYRGLLEAAPNG